MKFWLDPRSGFRLGHIKIKKKKNSTIFVNYLKKRKINEEMNMDHKQRRTTSLSGFGTRNKIDGPN